MGFLIASLKSQEVPVIPAIGDLETEEIHSIVLELAAETGRHFPFIHFRPVNSRYVDRKFLPRAGIHQC